MAVTVTVVRVALLVVVISVTQGLSHVSGNGVDNDVLENILNRLGNLEGQNALLEKLVLQLARDNQEQQTTIDHLTTKLNSIDVDNHGNNHKRFVLAPTLPIGFTARIPAATHLIDHVQPGNVIPFTEIITNYGAAFDNSSVFTAPMTGLYLVSCSLLDSFARHDGSGDMLHADIVINGQAMARVFAHAEGTSYRDQGAQTIILELQAGDKMWVRDWDSKDLTVGGDLFSTFSGYLLWPLE